MISSINQSINPPLLSPAASSSSSVIGPGGRPARSEIRRTRPKLIPFRNTSNDQRRTRRTTHKRTGPRSFLPVADQTIRGSCDVIKRKEYSSCEQNECALVSGATFSRGRERKFKVSSSSRPQSQHFDCIRLARIHERSSSHPKTVDRIRQPWLFGYLEHHRVSG